MNDKIETIREACIKANADLVELNGAEIPSRPIRLADVLLAIEEDKQVVISKEDDGAYFGKVSNGDTRYEHDISIRWSPAFWNLRADDLTQQSEETINFLYDLLK